MPPRSIVITGATSGIGHALALEYAEAGVHLALVGRRVERLQEIERACRARGAEVTTARIDVRDRGAMASWLREIDQRRPIDLAIPSAGITNGVVGRTGFEDPQAARAVIDINFGGVLNTIEPIIEAMRGRRRGHIALIGSMNAMRALPYAAAYCASKAAIHAYADALRPGLRASGIALSLVIPGFVATELNADIECPKPLIMNAAKAARIIRRGLARNKRVIVFPRLLYLGSLLFAVLPRALTDPVLMRIDVRVPARAPESVAKE